MKAACNECFTIWELAGDQEEPCPKCGSENVVDYDPRSEEGETP